MEKGGISVRVRHLDHFSASSVEIRSGSSLDMKGAGAGHDVVADSIGYLELARGGDGRIWISCLDDLDYGRRVRR